MFNSIVFTATVSSDIKLESLEEYSIVSRSTISNTFAELYDEDVKACSGSG
jgi:hypothetical protein